MKDYTPGRVQPVSLADIDPDPIGIQPREKLREDKVLEYREAYLDEDTDVPVITLWIITDLPGSKLRIIDGYHRHAGYAGGKIGNSIRAMVEKGTLAQAKARALKLNAIHGIALTAEQKRKAVLDILAEYKAKGVSYSIRGLAKDTGIHRSTVHRIVDEFRGDEGCLTETPRTPGRVPETVDDVDDTPATPREPREPKAPKDEEPVKPTIHTTVHDARQMFADIESQHAQYKRQIKAAAGMPGGAYLAQRLASFEKVLADQFALIRSCAPACVCPVCEGGDDGCAACKGHGFLTTEQDRARKEREKAAGTA